MKTIAITLGFIFAILLIQNAQAYVIDGDIVYWENAYGKISVYPHTSYELIKHTQYANITSYLPTQVFDFAFEFDFAVSGSIYILQGDEWIDKTHLFEHDIYNGKHFYWIKNVNFVQDETKEVKWIYKTPINLSGKWELWIKRSSDTIQEALSSGYYVNLDPWWNSTWGKKRACRINSTVSSTLTDYPAYCVMDTATEITEGDMQSDCDDIRIVNSTETGILSHMVENGTCNTANTYIYFKYPSLISGNQTVYIYYNNSLASNVEDAKDVFSNDFVSVWLGDGMEDYVSGYNWTNNNGVVLTTIDNRRVLNFTSGSSQSLSRGSGTPAFTTDMTWTIFWKPFTSGFSVFTSNQLLGSDGWTVEGGSGTNHANWGFNCQGEIGSPDWGHLTTNQYLQFHLTRNSTAWYIWENGSYVDIADYSACTDDTDRKVGRRGQNPVYADMYMDRIYWSNATRSADWIYAEANQFYSIGAEVIFPLPNISIISPENITYYNLNRILLNVDINFTGDTWRYSLNNASNITFTPDINLTSMILGVNTLFVYANSTGGDNYSANVSFTLTTACSGSSHVGNTTCAGIGMDYIANCKQLGKTTFQWDFDNLTFCPYGCFNGQCLNPLKTCRDRCQDNQTTCSGNYILECINQTDGCFDWTTDNKTFCRLGCIDGICVEGVSLCNSGDMKCEDERIVYCDDDDGDGYYDWSKYNFTNCRFGCIEIFNETTGKINATCNIHSFDIPYDARNILAYYGRGLNYIFDTYHLRLVFILFMMLVVGGLLGLKTGSWIGGLAGFLFVGFIGLIIWIPALFYIFILIAVIGGAVLLFASR